MDDNTGLLSELHSPRAEAIVATLALGKYSDSEVAATGKFANAISKSFLLFNVYNYATCTGRLAPYLLVEQCILMNLYFKFHEKHI